MMFSLIPEKYRLLATALALLLVALAIFAKGYQQGAAGVHADWNADRLIQTENAWKAESAAREKERALQTRLQDAQNEAAQREKTLRAAADNARAAAGGMRDTLADLQHRLPDITAAACRQTADTALAVLSECTDKYQRVAEAADGHASDARTLMEAWPE
jgi:Skp family chaperone for outer membrane proteins